MTQQCQSDGCFADTTCALGHLDRTKCEHWVTEAEETSGPRPQPNTHDLPWNSYALGTSDLAILAGRGRPVVVGLLGAPDSGKTSLLAFLYMWLLGQGEIPGWSFCGSWTLGAWESLVQPSRWAGEPPPSFPPHTSSGGRVPGMLHLLMRNERGVARDVLFTDAPGEWFTQWAKAPDSKSAIGGRWVIQRSDALLLLADCGALSNESTLPQARRDIRDLIERVGAEAPHIPLGFTWTKIDYELPSVTRDTVERSRLQFAPHSDVLETTTEKPETIARVLAHAIDVGESQPNHPMLYEPRISHDPFLAFRGYDVRS